MLRDYAFEKALKSDFEGESECSSVPVNSRGTIKIHHIHGAATSEAIKGTDRVTMTLKSYAEKAALEYKQKQERLQARAAAKTKRRLIYENDER